MRLPRLTSSSALFIVFVAAVALVLYLLLFVFQALWQNYVLSGVLRPEAKNEERLLIAAVASSLGSVAIAVLVAIAGMLDRSRVMAADRRKKGFELHAEAAYKMNKAVLTAYRLLQKAEPGAFKAADRNKIGLLFESAEEATLLLDDDIVQQFEQLWTEAEALAATLMAPSNLSQQNTVWTANAKSYASRQRILIAALRESLG